MTQTIINQIILKKRLLLDDERTQRKLHQAEKELAKKNNQLATLIHTMNMEEKDVKKLQSLTSLYHDLFGDKEV